MAGSEMEQRHVEAQLCVLPAQQLGFLIGAQREFCRAWPNQSAVTVKGRTCFRRTRQKSGFSHGKFCRQGAGWSNQMKTRQKDGMQDRRKVTIMQPYLIVLLRLSLQCQCPGLRYFCRVRGGMERRFGVELEPAMRMSTRRRALGSRPSREVVRKMPTTKLSPGN